MAKQCGWAELTPSHKRQKGQGEMCLQALSRSHRNLCMCFYLDQEYFSCGQLLECLATYLFFIHFLVPFIKHMSGVADDGMGPKKSDYVISSGNLTSVKEQDTNTCIINTSREERYAT